MKNPISMSNKASCTSHSSLGLENSSDNYKPVHKNRTLIVSALCGLLAMGGVVETSTAKESAAPIPEIKWNTTLNLFQFDHDKFVGQRFSANCPPLHVRDKSETIYGTEIYSSKSPICYAALHAGIIDDQGGIVTMQLNPGEASYRGTMSNGIESVDLPGTHRSLVFVDESIPQSSQDIHVKYVPRIDWNTKFTRTGFAHERMLGQQFTFECPAAPSNVRSRGFSGTDVYEFGSLICFAAAHDGRITMDGGYVTLRVDEGNKKLIGSIRNGIESRDGSSGRNSIVFVESTVQN